MCFSETQGKGECEGAVHRQEIPVSMWMLALWVFGDLLPFLCHDPGTGTSL